MAEIIKIDHNKELDTFIAYFVENPKNPVDTIEGLYDGHILFDVDRHTKELVSITIYDFSLVKKLFKKDYKTKATDTVVKRILSNFAETFSFGKNLHPEPA
jgi:hypothetical protein